MRREAQARERRETDLRSTEAGERPATSSRVEVVEKTRRPVRGKTIKGRLGIGAMREEMLAVDWDSRKGLIVTRISDEVY